MRECMRETSEYSENSAMQLGLPASTRTCADMLIAVKQGSSNFVCQFEHVHLPTPILKFAAFVLDPESPEQGLGSEMANNLAARICECPPDSISKNKRRRTE